jgi:hypothetical protein
MSSSKSPEALETLEADLRSRLDEEVRTLEAYRGRLEREARVDAELARIDAVIARRIGSIPPPAAPSYHPASYHPASFHSAPVPAMPSWNPPSSLLPPASIAPAPTSQPLPYAYQTSRMVTLSTISAMLAVIVSLTVLIITAGDRIIPSANAAERPTTSAPVSAVTGGSCSDKSDKSESAKKTDEAKTTTASAKSEPAPAAVAKTVAPASKSNVRRPATKSASPSKPEAPAAADAAPAAAPAPTNMDDAARTAQMLREQLGASLK